MPSSQVAGMTDPDMNIVLVKDMEKKRHRDGTSSRIHDHKKFMEPLLCPSSDGVFWVRRVEWNLGPRLLLRK